MFSEDDYRQKDFFVYKKTVMNRLVRLANFIPTGWMDRLLRLHASKPDSLWFTMSLTIATLFSTFLAEPVTYLRVIRLAHGKSLHTTLRVLPNYLSEGLYRFRNQFKLLQGRRGNR